MILQRVDYADDVNDDLFVQDEFQHCEEDYKDDHELESWKDHIHDSNKYLLGEMTEEKVLADIKMRAEKAEFDT